MSNGSPTAYLLWAILSSIFLAFLFLHLWAYDRFSSLKWGSGRQPGAFKRVMTYSYVATLPLLVVFSTAMTAIKFSEGYYMSPTGQIVPRPFSLYASHHKRWLLPLYFVLSVAWSLELVTHLEELAFWLFLLHQGPGKRDWFHSWEFRTFYLGSMIAVLGMPLTTLVTRREIERVQGWIFLAGASAGTTTTLSFLYVLFRFPQFIKYVKDEGAEPDVVVRLATFCQLNRIRVFFRFCYTVPLLIVGVDAVSGPFPIVGNAFALDFLLMMGGIGCFISSAITLLVFFPRSITREAGYKAKIISPQNSAKEPSVTSPLPNYYSTEYHESIMPKPASYAGHESHIALDGSGGGRSASVRMSSFRFPGGGGSVNHPVYATRSEPAHHRRQSMESHGQELETYEGESDEDGDEDGESIALGSPSHSVNTNPTFHHTMPSSSSARGHTYPHPHHPHHPHPNPSNSPTTAASRPTSGGKSDDTVWERMDDSTILSQRRGFSAGLQASSSHRMNLQPPPGSHSAPGSAPTSEEGHRSSERGSVLHPYVINFTSPIDLIDHEPYTSQYSLRPQGV